MFCSKWKWKIKVKLTSAFATFHYWSKYCYGVCCSLHWSFVYHGHFVDVVIICYVCVNWCINSEMKINRKQRGSPNRIYLRGVYAIDDLYTISVYRMRNHWQKTIYLNCCFHVCWWADVFNRQDRRRIQIVYSLNLFRQLRLWIFQARKDENKKTHKNYCC